MAKGSHDKSLATAFTSHLKETEEQIARLEKVGRLLEDFRVIWGGEFGRTIYS